MSGGRVVVIGGGLAGISAALDCAAAGADVTLLEARGRLGGAAYSFTRGELVADNGQHVFLRCCTAYRELLAQLGATELVTLQPRLDVPVLAPGGRVGWLRRSQRGRLQHPPLHLAVSLLRYRHLRLHERLAVGLVMQQLGRIDPDDPRNDERSFGDWLRRRGQGDRMIDAIWELISRPTINLRADETSLAQAAYVFQQGLLVDAAAGDIGWAVAPLSEIHDRAGRRALEAAGVEVRLRSAARMISPEHGSLARLWVQGSDGFNAWADAVVLAVPPARAAELLPSRAGIGTEFAQRLGSSPIVNLHVLYDRRVLEHPFAAGVGTPVQWVFDRTDSSGLSSGQYLAVSLSAADAELHETAEVLRARYLPALAELLPAARGAAVREFFVTREHAATFRAAPGSRAARPATRTQLPALMLAGSWTDTGWPATMEGAVRSGRAAAHEAMAAIRGRDAGVPQLQLAGREAA